MLYASLPAAPAPTPAHVEIIQTSVVQKMNSALEIPTVPFYSQFTDISLPAWRKVGCGIASLAMIIDYYKPAVPVDSLLKQGIAAGAFLQNAGWTHQGLIALGKKYGLGGSTHDVSSLGRAAAYKELKSYIQDGPVIVSVHYKFDPKSTIPHLVVIDGIENDIVYYNDPAAKSGQKQISVNAFLDAWKKKFIVIRPQEKSGLVT